MDESESLSHSKWECKYHVVFIPKCRRKTLYEQLRRHLGEVFRKLAEQKESRILEGHLMPDHVHMLIAIPPKYAVSQVEVDPMSRTIFPLSCTGYVDGSATEPKRSTITAPPPSPERCTASGVRLPKPWCGRSPL